MLKLRIDGRPYQLPVPPGMSLLQVIQEQLRADARGLGWQETDEQRDEFLR